MSRPRHMRSVAPIAEAIRERLGISGMGSVHLAAVSIGEASRHRPGVSEWLEKVRDLAEQESLSPALRAAFDEMMPGWEHLSILELDEGYRVRGGSLVIQGEPFAAWLRRATPETDDGPRALIRFIQRARAGQLPQSTIDALDALNPRWPNFHAHRENTPAARQRQARDHVERLRAGEATPETKRWLTRCRREATLGTLDAAVAGLLAEGLSEWRDCSVAEFATT